MGIKLIKILLTTFFFWFVAIVFVPISYAANFYLSPANKRVGVGETTSLQVRLNTNREVINAVSAYVSYPSDKVDVAFVSYSGSAFAISAENTYGGGLIKISRGNVNGVSGDLNVATIGFKPKTTGTANINFASGSAAVRESNSTDALSGSTGAVLTLSSTPQPSGAPQQSTSGFPVISDLKVEETATNSATISWKTDIASDSTVEFGLDKDIYILSVSNPELTKDHLIKVENPILIAGNTYHFVATSKILGGVESKSGDATFQLKGFTIKVKVQTPALKPLKEAEITLDTGERKFLTDTKGEALISDVSPGRHVLTARLNGQEKTEVVEVQATSNAQTFTILLSNAGGILGVNYWLWGLVILATLLGAGITFFIFVLPRLKKPNDPFDGLSKPTV